MTTVWVIVENFGGLTEGVKAYETEELAIAKAKERMEDHFKTCHNKTFSVEKVVATSDSNDQEQKNADYICDGTADEEEIQAAIDTVIRLRWNERFNTGSCPDCTDFMIGVYECPLHTEHSL